MLQPQNTSIAANGSNGTGQKLPMWAMFSSVFFLATSTALTAYFLSSYLKNIVEEKYVGLVFTISYIVSMVTINFFPYVISRLGALKSFLALMTISFLSLLMLARGDGNKLLLIVFMVFLASNALVWVNYDVIIEMFSKDSLTGRIRGLNLTLMNLGWVLTPLVTGWIISRYGFGPVFVLAALALVPPFLIIGTRIKPKKIKYPEHKPIMKIIAGVLASKPLRSVFAVSFLLAFFYSWMVIYTPLYLLNMGIDWPTIGKIFSVMLIPFCLVQYPVGYLADKYIGETEMLSLAIIIMSVSTASIFYASTPVMLAVLLFCTRVGAAIIEALRDSYFYKHISAKDVDLIDAFRNTGPLAYVIGPLVATASISFLPMPYLYPILGGVVLIGLFFTLTMPDTK